MTDDEMDLLWKQIYAFWRARDYEKAVDWSMQALGDRDPEDERGFSFCLRYLSQALVRADRETEATRWLEDGLSRFPQSADLRRGLAQHLWFTRRRPTDGLAVIEAAPSVAPDPTLSDEVKHSRLVEQILNLCLHVRLLTAVGRVAEAVEMMRTIPPLMPPWDPIISYLFDMEMVGELLQAGARDPAMADIANRVTEPRFLVNGLTVEQFASLKAYVNVPGFGIGG